MFTKIRMGSVVRIDRMCGRKGERVRGGLGGGGGVVGRAGEMWERGEREEREKARREEEGGRRGIGMEGFGSGLLLSSQVSAGCRRYLVYISCNSIQSIIPYHTIRLH